MKTIWISVLSAIILIIILLAAAFIWHGRVGLTSFSFKTGDLPKWDGGVNDVTALRFLNTIFTVTMSDGTSKTLDVSPVLNRMTQAYVDVKNPPHTLSLVRNLNPFSFVIPGFNDVGSVPDPSTTKWTSAKVTLAGNLKVI
jgi:hypothetical protein